MHQFERDASGRLLAQIDPLNRRTEYVYDPAGNITQITHLAGTPEAVSTRITYNSLSRPTQVTNALGQSTTTTYDLMGNLTQVTNPLGKSWTLTRNSKGQLTKVTDPLGKATNYSYDGPDLASITDPLGRKTTQFTDSVGRPLLQTSPSGARTEARYDVLNRQTQLITPQGHVIGFTWDPAGQLTAHTDEKGLS